MNQIYPYDPTTPPPKTPEEQHRDETLVKAFGYTAVGLAAFSLGYFAAKALKN